MNSNVNEKASEIAAPEVKAANEWIDRYVHEVGRRLPLKQRADVEREIRSLIEDEVAGRLDALEADGVAKPDMEAAVLAVLARFGAPEEIAGRYQAPRYLIGPAMFPIFQIVLGIVLAVTVFANLLGLAVAAGTGDLADPLVDTLARLLMSIIQAFGTVALIFMGLERLGVNAGSKQAANWDPRKLPPVKDDQRVNMVETAIEIGFTAALLGLTISYLNTETGPVYYNGDWQPIPLFSQHFLQFIPWLMVLWGAGILVNIVLLARGRWEAATRIAALVLAGATAFLFYQILIGPPIAAWAPLDPAFKITAAIIFGVSLWEAAKQGWQLVRGSVLGTGALRSQHVA